LARDVGRRIAVARVSQAAAAMSYFALFSLFPLLLVLVAAGGYVLASEEAYRLVVDLVSGAFPASVALIETNVQRVIRLRGPVGILSLLTLVWSASSFFFSLTTNVERAWPQASNRSIAQRRLVAIGMVVSLAGLMAASLLANALLAALPEAPYIGDLSVFGASVWGGISQFMPWILTFLMYLSLYRWIPSATVTWRAAMWGAGLATVLWHLAGTAFVLYLGSGLARYELVYGSLGALVVLMLWIYITCWLTLAGAHLSAAISQRGRGDTGTSTAG
jgi:membrane protein